jgi:xylulokinase
MTRATLLAIDVGTTGVRAAVYTEQGQVVAQAAQTSPYAAPAPGRAEANAEEWWHAACAVIERVGQQAPLAHLEAIGVTGQAPTAVLVDANGRAIGRAILWLDVRADAEARAIDAALGPGGAEAIGGNRMHAYYLGPKLSWLQANERALMDRAAAILQSHAFVVMRLTGAVVCDPSTAMLCAPLFDAQSGAWSNAAARACGVPMRLLPRIAPAHEVVGAVTRDAAVVTGLREGVAVVAGGGDFAATTLGAGVIDEGEACLMLGTAGNLLMPLTKARFDARLINSHHVGCDRWLALGGTLCGAALDWFRATCAADLDWQALEAEAAAVDPDAMGALTVLPYLQGERTPIWDENARGAFYGIDLTHRRGHLYRALLEGVALGFRHCLSVAQELGIAFGEVTAANGAGKSPLLRQTLSDALGLPLTWRDAGQGGGTLAGAALLAGIGAGLVPGPKVARSWLRPGLRHEPNARAHERLCDVFSRRLSLYAAVRAGRGIG